MWPSPLAPWRPLSFIKWISWAVLGHPTSDVWIPPCHRFLQSCPASRSVDKTGFLLILTHLSRGGADEQGNGPSHRRRERQAVAQSVGSQSMKHFPRLISMWRRCLLPAATVHLPQTSGWESERRHFQCVLEIIKYNACKSTALTIQLCMCPCSHLPRETDESAPWRSLFVCYSAGACLPACLPSPLTFPPSFLFLLFVTNLDSFCLSYLKKDVSTQVPGAPLLIRIRHGFSRALLTLAKVGWESPASPSKNSNLPEFTSSVKYNTTILH